MSTTERMIDAINETREAEAVMMRIAIKGTASREEIERVRINLTIALSKITTVECEAAGKPIPEVGA